MMDQIHIWLPILIASVLGVGALVFIHVAHATKSWPFNKK